ncbi:MAG TPA: energy transducer TonB [Ignavibacteria bacterium]|nr:energy transducer TonB [Ignavibacteria bacterium]HMQ98975.1 energy transducer TonB [Ignavibacteria bacterium]
MKYILISIFLIIIFSQNVFTQKSIEYSLYDSVNILQDTVISKEVPECINYIEVFNKIEWPNQVDGWGYVYAACLIDTNGNVESLLELKGVEIFYEAVKKVIYLLKFKPGKINNHSVKYTGIVPFKFIIY